LGGAANSQCERIIAGREVNNVISKNNLVRTIVSDVDEVIAEPIKEFEEMPLCKRSIYVNTEQGETFVLEIYAEEKEKLEFKNKFNDDWLTPKLYKGKSMHELEMEEGA
jgi:hypothetical protein